MDVPSQPSTPQDHAVQQCAQAWKRAYDLAFLQADRLFSEREEQSDRFYDEDDTPEQFAAHEAAVAFRDAMPPLSGYDSIRSFIACVTHAMLYDVLPASLCQNLLAAAKIALAALRALPPAPETYPSPHEKICENCLKNSAISTVLQSPPI